jgi:hypothetical protein
VVQDGAASDKSQLPVLDYAGGSTNEHAEWHEVVPAHYDGGGFTWKYRGATDGSQTAATNMDLRILTVADDTVLTGDLDVDGQTASSIDDSPPSTPTNKLNYSTTSTLTHANAGSPSTGSKVIVRLTRDAATDTNTDDMQIASVEILET